MTKDQVILEIKRGAEVYIDKDFTFKVDSMEAAFLLNYSVDSKIKVDETGIIKVRFKSGSYYYIKI